MKLCHARVAALDGALKLGQEQDESGVGDPVEEAWKEDLEGPQREKDAARRRGQINVSDS